MSAVSYAVLAKARSKFGKRLTDKDYASLLSCQSVTEVMSYLKSYTHYSEALRDVNEREIHRGRLEALLRQNLFYEFSSLCRYDTGLGSGFSEYVVELIDTEQIVRFLVLLHSNSTDRFIYQFPAYFLKHTSIDISRLSNATTYDEFLNVISDSQYYCILKKFKPDENGKLEISKIENELLAYVYKNIFEAVSKHTKGQEKQELKLLFRTIIDYGNFSRILRLKKYYNLPPDTIRENLFTSYSSINPKIYDMMCKAESSAEIFSIMQSTHTGKLIDKLGYVYASDITPRVKYKLARKNMHFSNNPSSVMISYMFVSETELMNVISLIEGIRYKLDSKVIQSMLIYS